MAAPTVPRTYRPRLSPLWWTQNRRYLLYFFREITGLVMALWLILLIAALLRLRVGDGGAAHALVTSQAFQTFSAVTLGFSLLHSITWFQLVGWVGLPAPRGKKIVTGPKLVVPFFLLWVVFSGLIWLLLFRGF